MRTYVILITLIAVTAIVPSGSCEEMTNPVRFAIISDRTGGHVPGIHGQIAIEIERLRPDFVMTVGDMIEGYVDDSARIINEWIEYDSIIDPISPEIHWVPGNHDIWSDMSEELYRRFVGEPYYSFDHGGIHFVVLDVSRYESSSEMSAEQLEWLVQDLENSRDASYTMIFYHKPFWEQTIAEGRPDTLHAIFREYGIDAVFCGHYHDYFSSDYDGIMYTCLGSSGGVTTPAPCGLEYHFAWVTVDNSGIHVAPIMMGAVQPWDVVTTEEREYYTSIRRKGLTIEKPLPVGEDLSVTEAGVTVVLDNMKSELALNDTIRWAESDNWRIGPLEMPATVEPGAKGSFDFKAECLGDLYPLPTASVNFAYAEDQFITAGGGMRIAREINCRSVSAEPSIDGDISEDSWGEPVTILFDPDGTAAKTDPARFYFAHDEQNLYIAAYCKEAKIDSIRANATEHDGAVWSEDCVGYFFESVLGSDTVYQIYINPNGAVFDQKLTMGDAGFMDADRGWNGEYEVKAIIGDDFWSMEARIPIAQLGASLDKEDTWRLNFRRKQSRLNGAANWQTPIDYDPSTYGIMTMK
jgi:predicted phosphodiesterase